MAIIKCGECGNEVSSRATACPKCGNPIASAITGTAVVTTEATAKKYKTQQLVAVALICLGFIIPFGASGSGSTSAFMWGPLMIVGGLILLFVARVGAWWHHG